MTSKQEEYVITVFFKQASGSNTYFALNVITEIKDKLAINSK